jgi:hypothetical protein
VLRMYDNASFVACLEREDDDALKLGAHGSSASQRNAGGQKEGDTIGMEGAMCIEQVTFLCFACDM